MRFGPVTTQDKAGRDVILRSAQAEDAKALIRYLAGTAGETPYLLREPEEVTLTAEQETAFVQRMLDAERELMLVAMVDGELAGTCSLTGSPFLRSRHRCEVSVALYRKFCGAGIGELLMRQIPAQAEQAGYEQAELEVVAGNRGAVGLYKKLGFAEYGRFPCRMKYRDGSCADALWMMKRL